MKRLGLVMCAVGVLVLGCKKPEEVSGATGPSKTRLEGLPKVQVASAAVESGELSRMLEITGQLNAEETSNVATMVPGTVVETPVDVGDVVKRGDALLKLDDRDARLRLQSAQAQVMQIRAKLNLPMEDPKDGDKPVVNVDQIPEVRLALANQESARVDLDRSKKLYDEKAISVQQYDLARLKLDVAESNVAMARNGIAQAVASLASVEAQVAMARKGVNDMTVRAPFNGAVVRRNVSVGEYAAPQAPLMQLVKSEVLRLALDVPETAVGALQLGQEVEVSVQGRVIAERGKVARIAPAVDGNTRSMRVEARVENPKGTLKPGMFAQARVMLNAHDLALWVPREAVVTLSGSSKVFLISGNHVEERIVVVGDNKDGLVEVRGQLKVGDRVVIKNADKLVDGAPVDS